MKKITILRGLPGSGKSTWAKKQIAENSNTIKIASVSADTYFVRPDGRYDWNPKLLGNAHDWCFEQFKHYVAFCDYDHVIVDNTNVEKKHIKRYTDFARMFKYEIEIKMIGSTDEQFFDEYTKRNVHGVKKETIEKMAHKMEDDSLKELGV